MQTYIYLKTTKKLLPHRLHWRTVPAPSVQHDRVIGWKPYRFFTLRSESKCAREGFRVKRRIYCCFLWGCWSLRIVRWANCFYYFKPIKRIYWKIFHPRCGLSVITIPLSTKMSTPLGNVIKLRKNKAKLIQGVRMPIWILLILHWSFRIRSVLKKYPFDALIMTHPLIFVGGVEATFTKYNQTIPLIPLKIYKWWRIFFDPSFGFIRGIFGKFRICIE